MDKMELSLTATVIGAALMVLLTIQAVHGFVHTITENYPQKRAPQQH